MSKEHDTLTEFFNFLVTKQNYLQQDTEEAIQDYYNYKAELAAKAKEEKRIKQLKKLELIVQQREEQIARARIPKPIRLKPRKIASTNIIIVKESRSKGPKIKTMNDLRKLIDRIRN